jgi:hypothetical protein
MGGIHHSPCAAGLLICYFLALAGCGKDNVVLCAPVQGKVTLGTRPLVGGWVTFIPLSEDGKGPRPEGRIDAQGHYSLKTAGRDGAPPGKYRATLAISGMDKAQNSEFNPLYGHWQKSPLIIAVIHDAPAGAYDLKLDPL